MLELLLTAVASVCLQCFHSKHLWYTQCSVSEMLSTPEFRWGTKQSKKKPTSTSSTQKALYCITQQRLYDKYLTRSFVA